MKLKHVSNEDDDVSSTTARKLQYMDALRGVHNQDAEESDMLALASKLYIHLEHVMSIYKRTHTVVMKMRTWMKLLLLLPLEQQELHL